jgi:hypothetical protein
MRANDRRRIEKWARGALLRKIEPWNPDEMHIDEVARRYQNPKAWLLGGIECLRVARALRDELCANDVICLVYYLRDDRMGDRVGRPPPDFNGLGSSLNYVPPVLVWLREAHISDYLAMLSERPALADWTIPIDSVSAHYYQYERPPGELSRTVWLVSRCQVR